MKDWKNILVIPTQTVREVIEVIDKNAVQIALVVDKNTHLLGTVTDGDIRRGILKGIALDSPVEKIMNSSPTTLSRDQPSDAMLALMRQKHLRQIPLLDQQGQVVGLKTLIEFLNPKIKDNWVVVMAGGQGLRLGDLTKDCPKPMLTVGAKPLLETILENFIAYGFRKFYLAVNYLGEKIQEYFGDGKNWGIEIRYINETKRLGSAGALSLLPEIPKEAVIVMNGDILTKVNFHKLLECHSEQGAQGTMCVREYDFQVPYGVVQVNEYQLTEIVEKPIHRFFVNAGIYVLEPSCIEKIPKNVYFDMPELFNKLLIDKKSTAVFPIREYWIDVGQVEEFDKANGEFSQFFKS
jgi:dTDP-glucose pyrophosphorylase